MTQYVGTCINRSVKLLILTALMLLISAGYGINAVHAQTAQRNNSVRFDDTFEQYARIENNNYNIGDYTVEFWFKSESIPSSSNEDRLFVMTKTTGGRGIIISVLDRNSDGVAKVRFRHRANFDNDTDGTFVETNRI
ncbi:MAG: hypothetical protein ACYTBP_14590, partial [Planctomycetota bacterium]